MKVITVWQPWASLIAIGAKPYEFRGWVPPQSVIGQRIGIHAGARPMKKDEIFTLLQQLRYPEKHGTPCLIAETAGVMLQIALDRPNSFPLSHILCTAILGPPKRGDICAREFGVDAGNDSNREGTFNWGWPLSDIQHLTPPVPMKGMQGLWNWSGTA